MTRIRIAMILLAVLFAVYGVMELREEIEDGRSLRDGIEALALSGTFLAVGIWLRRFDSRRRDIWDVL